MVQSFLENDEINQIYTELGSSIYEMAILKDIRIQEIYKIKSDFMRRHSQEYLMESPIPHIAKRLLSIKNTINYENLQKVQNRIAPLITYNEIIEFEFADQATTYLHKMSRCKKIQNQILSYLEHAIFTDGDIRYRIEFEQKKNRIYGENSHKLYSLSGIAHEIGHLLAEDIASKQPLLPCYSEFTAFYLEEAISYHFLSLETSINIANEYLEYNSKIDSLNILFAQKELVDLGLSAFEDDFLWDPDLLVIRETYFSKLGFQLIYGIASLLRIKIRNPEEYKNLVINHQLFEELEMKFEIGMKGLL